MASKSKQLTQTHNKQTQQKQNTNQVPNPQVKQIANKPKSCKTTTQKVQRIHQQQPNNPNTITPLAKEIKLNHKPKLRNSQLIQSTETSLTQNQ